MILPALDNDGYPTESTINAIREWRIDTPKDARDLMGFVREAWKYDDYFEVSSDDVNYRIHTGGWSGNEDLIDALRHNYIFWMFYWVSSRRGGHYEFEIRREI